MQQVYVLLGKRLGREEYLHAVSKSGCRVALHPDAQLRVDALAAISRESPVDLVVCSGGRTAGGALPSEARSLALSVELADYGPRLPRFLLDEESLNTNENAERIKALLEKTQYFTLHVITSGYHAKRVDEIFRTHHLNIEVLPAEDIIARLIPERKEEMRRYKASFRFRMEQLREWVSRMLPKQLLTILAHLVRK